MGPERVCQVRSIKHQDDGGHADAERFVRYGQLLTLRRGTLRVIENRRKQERYDAEYQQARQQAGTRALETQCVPPDATDDNSEPEAEEACPHDRTRDLSTHHFGPSGCENE